MLIIERYFQQYLLATKEVDIMVKFIGVVFAAALTAVSMTGCVVVKEYAPAAEAKAKINPAEYELGRSLLTAFVKNDAEKFVGLLPEETREKFTVESFKKTRESIVKSVGEPVEFTYLTRLELETLTPQIWRVRFRRANLKNTQDFYSELLFRIVTGTERNKKAVITSFQFL
jgi:hypothetical protein